jgi:hypothetical protein
MKLFLLNTLENKKSRKIGLIFLGFFCNFLHISKAGQKKRKMWNSIGLILARTGPTTQETRARPRPRWWLYRKALRVLANWEQVLLLFHRVADSLQKCPPVSIPSQREVHDGGGRREAPASTCTG